MCIHWLLLKCPLLGCILISRCTKRAVRSMVYSQIIAEVGASTCIKGGFLMQSWQHIRFAVNVLLYQDNLPLENKNEC